jgi:hypothetical protein
VHHDGPLNSHEINTKLLDLTLRFDGWLVLQQVERCRARASRLLAASPHADKIRYMLNAAASLKHPTGLVYRKDSVSITTLDTMWLIGDISICPESPYLQQRVCDDFATPHKTN